MSEEPKLNSAGFLIGEGNKFVKGTKPGPGRTPGSISIKDLVRQYLEDHPEELDAFVRHFIRKNRELAWQMLEGRPQQDVTTGGEKLPQPLLANLNVHLDDGHQENLALEEKN